MALVAHRDYSREQWAVITQRAKETCKSSVVQNGMDTAWVTGRNSHTKTDHPWDFKGRPSSACNCIEVGATCTHWSRKMDTICNISFTNEITSPYLVPTSFLSSPFLTCCAILQTSFGGKGPHLRQWLVAQLLHHSLLRFSGVFLSYKASTMRSVHSP